MYLIRVFTMFVNFCKHLFEWKPLQRSHSVLGWVLEGTHSDEKHLLTTKRISND